jgi:hypothetical protein
MPTLIGEDEEADEEGDADDEEDELVLWLELLLLQAAAAATVIAATAIKAPGLLRILLLPPCVLGRRLAAALGWGQVKR